MLSAQTIAILVVAAVVAAGLIGLLFRPKGPPTATFKCARCSVVARHSNRTVNAWKSGAKRMYCESCHREWLRANPGRAVAPSSGRGCFAVSLALILIPTGLYFAVLYA